MRLSRPDPESVSRLLLDVLLQLEAALKKGTVVSMTEREIRVRYLPIGSPESPIWWWPYNQCNQRIGIYFQKV